MVHANNKALKQLLTSKVVKKNAVKQITVLSLNKRWTKNSSSLTKCFFLIANSSKNRIEHTIQVIQINECSCPLEKHDKKCLFTIE